MRLRPAVDRMTDVRIIATRCSQCGDESPEGISLDYNAPYVPLPVEVDAERLREWGIDCHKCGGRRTVLAVTEPVE